MPSFWQDDDGNFLVDSSGQLYFCNECPCEGGNELRCATFQGLVPGSTWNLRFTGYSQNLSEPDPQTLEHDRSQQIFEIVFLQYNFGPNSNTRKTLFLDWYTPVAQDDSFIGSWSIGSYWNVRHTLYFGALTPAPAANKPYDFLSGSGNAEDFLTISGVRLEDIRMGTMQPVGNAHSISFPDGPAMSATGWAKVLDDNQDVDTEAWRNNYNRSIYTNSDGPAYAKHTLSGLGAGNGSYPAGDFSSGMEGFQGTRSNGYDGGFNCPVYAWVPTVELGSFTISGVDFSENYDPDAVTAATHANNISILSFINGTHSLALQDWNIEGDDIVGYDLVFVRCDPVTKRIDRIASADISHGDPDTVRDNFYKTASVEGVTLRVDYDGTKTMGSIGGWDLSSASFFWDNPKGWDAHRDVI